MYTLRPRRAYGQICGLTRINSAKQALRVRIVAQEEVAGSSPVSHPPGHRIGKPGKGHRRKISASSRDVVHHAVHHRAWRS